MSRSIRKMILALASFMLAATAVGETGETCAQNKAILFKIESRLPDGNNVSLTGFRARDFPGILTSLHGVAGASGITATSNDSSKPVMSGLQVAWVDIEDDVAALEPVGSTLPNEGFEVDRENVTPNENLTACGHPVGMDLRPRPAPANAWPTKPLSALAGTNVQLATRKSPALTITIIDLNASMGPGESGEPIFDLAGHVQGIVDGGIGEGKLGISWAIPIGKIHLKPTSEQKRAYHDLLDKPASNLVFAYETGTTLNPHEFFISMDGGNAHTLCYAFANAREGDTILVRPGTYRLGSSGPSCDRHVGSSEPLRSVAVKGVGSKEETIFEGNIDIPEGITVKLGNFTLFGAISNHGQADLVGVRVKADRHNPSVQLSRGSITRIDHSIIEANEAPTVDANTNATISIADSQIQSDKDAIWVSDGTRLIIDHCGFTAENFAIFGIGAHVEVRTSDLSRVRGRRGIDGNIQLIANSHGSLSLDAYTKAHE